MDVITLLIYFMVGVVQDFFFTLNTKYVAEKKVFWAVVFSFLTVLISMWVLYDIVSSIDRKNGILAIFVYACGIATGTYFAMKMPGLKEKK